MLDNIGVRVWGVIAAFLTISGFISGFALSNGLNQQEHRVINLQIKMLEEEKNITRQKLEAINSKLDDLLYRYKNNDGEG